MENIKEIREKIKHLSVLFVDDEEDFRAGSSKLLQKFFIDVATASNGEEALRIYGEHGGYDVIITDLLMPKLDGESMLEKLREKDFNGVSVVLSASKQELMKEKKIADYVFQKPLAYEELIELLKELGARYG